MMNFEQLGSSHRNFTSPLCLLFLLSIAGCFSHRAVPAAALGNLGAAAAKEPEARVLLQGEDGAKVPLEPRSRVRFVRADGSCSPWLRAGELWLSAEGVLVRHRHPLEALREIRIAGLDEGAVNLLLQAAPAGALALDLGQGLVGLKAEPGPLAAWVRDFVVALAQQRAPHIFQQEGQGFALLSPLRPDQRYARVIGELRRATDGSFLGSWGLAVRTEEWHWVRGPELLRTLDEGLELLDGLSFADLRTLEVERFDLGKTAAAVVLTGAVVVIGLAVAVVTAPLGGRGPSLPLGGGGVLGKLVPNIGGDGDPDAGPRLAGYTLWIAPLPTPSSTGARPLFAFAPARL